MNTNLYTKAVSNILFPLHERLKGHDSVNLRQQLESSQWKCADEIGVIANEKLQTFIASVYNTVPYYKKLLDTNNLAPSDIKTAADLSKIPFLTKEIIRNNEDELRATGAQGLRQFNTGGSSGSPLIFYLNQERVSHDVAAKWRATRWWDVDIGDKEIVAWGSPIELNGQDRIKLLRDALFRSQLIPAFNLTEQSIAKFIQRIQKFKPKMLFGYPSVYDLIGQYAEKHNIPLNNLGIKVAFVTSERLYDHQRERIESVFNCPVANGYGGRDAGFIAHQCPDGGMHISAEDIIVEIVGPEGIPLPPGESGEIVVTHMATSAFPFIRYRTGDIGTISTETCSCGRGLPLLDKIEGRTTDFIIAKDGTRMHGLALIYILREEKTIRNFKIMQESIDHTKIFIESSSCISNDIKNRISSKIKDRLGKSVTVEIIVEDNITSESSGKFRYVQSKVGENLQ
ncbi:MAG: AMP-binding protein [Motiliproteus sp.]|nr:AMP-binding protein [Motiliproteus sp.]MCW9052387.1 AMP-binding protein [Motiliproteus sp.]